MFFKLPSDYTQRIKAAGAAALFETDERLKQLEKECKWQRKAIQDLQSAYDYNEIFKRLHKLEHNPITPAISADKPAKRKRCGKSVRRGKK